MAAENVLRMPALGRVAQLGSLYNAKDHIFYSENIESLCDLELCDTLKSIKPDTIIRKVDFETTCPFEKFGVSDDLKRAVLSREVPIPNSSLRFFSQEQETMEVNQSKIALYYCKQEYQQTKVPHNRNLQKEIHTSKNPMNEQATHYISSIIYGYEMFSVWQYKDDAKYRKGFVKQCLMGTLDDLCEEIWGVPKVQKNCILEGGLEVLIYGAFEGIFAKRFTAFPQATKLFKTAIGFNKKNTQITPLIYVLSELRQRKELSAEQCIHINQLKDELGEYSRLVRELDDLAGLLNGPAGRCVTVDSSLCISKFSERLQDKPEFTAVKYYLGSLQQITPETFIELEVGKKFNSIRKNEFSPNNLKRFLEEHRSVKEKLLWFNDMISKGIIYTKNLKKLNIDCFRECYIFLFDDFLTSRRAELWQRTNQRFGEVILSVQGCKDKPVFILSEGTRLSLDDPEAAIKVFRFGKEIETVSVPNDLPMSAQSFGNHYRLPDEEFPFQFSYGKNGKTVSCQTDSSLRGNVNQHRQTETACADQYPKQNETNDSSPESINTKSYPKPGKTMKTVACQTDIVLTDNVRVIQRQLKENQYSQTETTDDGQHLTENETNGFSPESDTQLFPNLPDNYVKTLGPLENGPWPFEHYTPLSIPCPSYVCEQDPQWETIGCSSEPREWTCCECKEIVRCGYDGFIYCSCGRTKPSVSPATHAFKCTHETHGGNYVPLDKLDDIENYLKKINPAESAEEFVNILLLGQTGVGKSTFINAFANYISFESLLDAEREESPICLIPSKFTVSDQDLKLETITFGKPDTNEVLGDAVSQTQHCRGYTFPWERKIVRLIDTPGIGDTRGRSQDQLNVVDMVKFISQYSQIHGICFLLKPNESRLSTTFVSCFLELFKQLHKSASQNIFFVFTNASGTSFKPGDTFTVLKKLLSENFLPDSEVKIDLTPDRYYCMDNEAFRYLVLKFNNKHFDEEETAVFTRSWSKSAEESRRMIRYVCGLPPHKLDQTVVVGLIKQVILVFTNPLAEATLGLQQEIVRLEMEIQRIKTSYSSTDRKKITGAYHENQIKDILAKIDTMQKTVLNLKLEQNSLNQLRARLTITVRNDSLNRHFDLFEDEMKEKIQFEKKKMSYGEEYILLVKNLEICKENYAMQLENLEGKLTEKSLPTIKGIDDIVKAIYALEVKGPVIRKQTEEFYHILITDTGSIPDVIFQKVYKQ